MPDLNKGVSLAVLQATGGKTARDISGMNGTKTRTAFVFAENSRVLRVFFACTLALFVSACATTSGNHPQVSQAVEKGCTSEGEGKGGCAPKGVIEISENYGVDPAVREEFKKSVALLSQEKYPEAIKLLIDVTGKTNKFTAPYINLGIAYARTGKMKEAEDSLKKALEINKHHPVALNELGLVYRKTGRYKEAREVYQSVLDVYPEFLPARKNLGVLCDIYLQDLNCALSEYEAYLKRVPDDKKVKIWIADVKNRMK